LQRSVRRQKGKNNFPAPIDNAWPYWYIVYKVTLRVKKWRTQRIGLQFFCYVANLSQSHKEKSTGDDWEKRHGPDRSESRWLLRTGAEAAAEKLAHELFR
jgi:hypothetical protein